MHDPPVRRVPPASRRDPKQGTLIGQSGQARRLPDRQQAYGPPAPTTMRAGYFGGFQYPTLPLRVGEDRRRDAVDKVTALSFDRHGNRIWRDARSLLESEHARYAVGEVAVPYGRCSEPANVRAGGGACPVRFRCAGCDHFRTDVSYLPDLTAYLDDLLRTRERLAAAIDGVDEWARADATPAEEEITRIRRLIARIHGDIAQLPAAERAQVDQAVTVIRKHRAVNLGMPALPPSPAARAHR
jgi:hypothetical protein